jgi:hypothetical protein
MHKCKGWVLEKGRQGVPLRGRPCGLKAVVKIPEGMDLTPGWVCAYHAPVKLLPNFKKETTA